MTISLAFLAPDLVKAAIDGRLPHGGPFAMNREISVCARLRGGPGRTRTSNQTIISAFWSRQTSRIIAGLSAICWHYGDAITEAENGEQVPGGAWHLIFGLKTRERVCLSCNSLQRRTVKVRDLHAKASQQNPAANDSAVHQFIHHCSNCDHGVGS